MTGVDRVPRVLCVTDGSTDSEHAASVAAALFPSADVEVMATVPLDRSVYAGTTGFAGPVIGDDELGELERQRQVDAMGDTAATARAVGPKPVRQTIHRGDPVDAVADVVARSHPDVVVIASTASGGPGRIAEIAGDVLDRVARPVIVVPPPTQRGDVP